MIKMAKNTIIEVKTWHNSAPNNTTGSGYGIRFSSSDFEILKNWKEIILGDSGIILKRGRIVLNQPCPMLPHDCIVWQVIEFLPHDVIRIVAGI